MSTREILQGDYVNYVRPYDDGIGTGYEHGAGYVELSSDNWVTIRTMDRLIRAPRNCCTILAEQYRLDI